MTKLCKYDIIILTNKFIYQATHLVSRKGDCMKNKGSKITYISVYCEDDKVVVTVEKSTAIDCFREVNRNGNNYVVSQSCGRLVDSFKKRVIKNGSFLTTVRCPGELSMKLKQVPLQKGDKVRVTKEGEVIVTRERKSKSYSLIAT